VTEIPLFPLRSVLCPGQTLPLHIFEERYRLMIGRCIDRGEPFGVVLIREGRDVGPLTGEVAAIGTTAAIRRVGTYPDGRLDILSVGQQRFRLESVDNVSEPYLVGRVSLLDEPSGPEAEVRALAQRVGGRFLEYLELLQPEGVEDGPEIEIEIEIEVDDEDAEDAAAGEAGSAARATPPTADVDGLMPLDSADPLDSPDPPVQEVDATDLSPEQRRELLMRAARRLVGTDDATVLSYLLTALIQVDLAACQGLLEASDTLGRLTHLDTILARESWFLRLGLRPIIIAPDQMPGPRG
jgi:Lon protease-like protein